MEVNQMFFKGDEKPVFDLTQDTVTPDNLLEGVTAHDHSGEAITGTLTAVKDVVDSNNQSLVTNSVARLPEYVENTAGEYGSITINGIPTNYTSAINIGDSSRVSRYSVAIGSNAATEKTGGTAIGRLAIAKGNYCVAFGFDAHATAESCIQIGWGDCTEDYTANFGGQDMSINKITRFDRNVGRTVECICMDDVAPTDLNSPGTKGMMAISEDGEYLYVHNGKEWRQIPLNTFRI